MTTLPSTGLASTRIQRSCVSLRSCGTCETFMSSVIVSSRKSRGSSTPVDEISQYVYGPGAPPDTVVQLLDSIFRNILQHQYTHTAQTHADSSTSSLFLQSIMTDEAWRRSGTNAFGHASTNAIESIEPPLFGRRFQDVLRDHPKLSASVPGFLKEIRSLSDRARDIRL